MADTKGLITTDDKIIRSRKESYSSLDLHKKCPYKYYIKYILGKYTDASSIALDMGTLNHLIMEYRKKPSATYSIDELMEIYHKGYLVNEENLSNAGEDEEKSVFVGEKILGLDEIKNKYYEIYNEVGRKSNLKYSEKIEIFLNYLNSIPNGNWKIDKDWNVLAVEFPFIFNYQGIDIRGKIDLIEINKNGEIRITDYKTSDGIYDDKDIKTPMQMFIYAKAIKEIFDKFPTEFIYDFILIGKKQTAMSKGWESRGEKALSKMIEDLKNCYHTGIFQPKPIPLCFWCEFSNNTCIKDEKTNGLCQYYSLWTPDNRTFAVNKKWEVNEFKNSMSNNILSNIETIEVTETKKNVVTQQPFIW